MNTYHSSGLYRIAGLAMIILFLSATLMAQKPCTEVQKPAEMTSLKKLVLGIPNTGIDKPSSLKVLRHIDFEEYVEKEILLERWMHTREYWYRGDETLIRNLPLEDWMYSRDAWRIIDTDPDIMIGEEKTPEIILAKWMFAEEFMNDHWGVGKASTIERWMIDRSLWAMSQ